MSNCTFDKRKLIEMSGYYILQSDVSYTSRDIPNKYNDRIISVFRPKNMYVSCTAECNR